jgi:hypothetical protein
LLDFPAQRTEESPSPLVLFRPAFEAEVLADNPFEESLVTHPRRFQNQFSFSLPPEFRFLIDWSSAAPLLFFSDFADFFVLGHGLKLQEKCRPLQHIAIAMPSELMEAK